MSDDTPPADGLRKDGSPYKPGNTRADGDYEVGKNRPPEHTRFRKNDGRKRGRRPKGQRNFETEFNEEARRQVTIREGGRERRVSKMRSVIIRAFDNAAGKGDSRALQTLFATASRLSEASAKTSEQLTAAEAALVDAWLDQQIANRLAGDCPGDSVEPAEGDCLEDTQEKQDDD